MQTLLLTLLSILVMAYADDEFIFDVQLHCKHPDRPTFRFNMQFIEVDSFVSANDPITMQRHGEARPGTAYLDVRGSQDGDEEGSSFYDVRMILYHDCTEYEKETLLELDVTPRCQIGKGICRFKIDKDITDASGRMEYQAKLDYQ